MNNDIRFYIVTSEAIENESVLEKMLTLICNNKASVTKYNNIYGVSGVKNDGFSKLINCIQPLKNDLKLEYLSIVVVPCFNEVFVNLLDVKETKVYYLFDLLVEKAQSGKLDVMSLKSIFNNVPDNILQTIKQYINFNQSIICTSEAMFTHRNTINYRLNKFIQLTGINIRETNSAMAIYLLLKLLKI